MSQSWNVCWLLRSYVSLSSSSSSCHVNDEFYETKGETAEKAMRFPPFRFGTVVGKKKPFRRRGAGSSAMDWITAIIYTHRLVIDHGVSIQLAFVSRNCGTNTR